MNKLISNKPTIIFRSDSNPNIGAGHFIRTLALAEFLNKEFYCIFAIQSPTQSQINQIRKICHQVIGLKYSENHFNEFHDLLNGDEIVVLDNYYFDSEYQKSIKQKGCKLICIDDLHDKHFFADVVINHAYGLVADDYSTESYTRICLGFDYALVRKQFFQNKSISRNSDTLLINFGGSDFNNLTEKYTRYTIAMKKWKKITIVTGDGYLHYNRLSDMFKDSNVEIKKNISAKTFAFIMAKTEKAVLPASGVLLEAFCSGMQIAAGYYINNQRVFYENLLKNKMIIGLGDLLKNDKEAALSDFFSIPYDPPPFSISYSDVKKNFITLFDAISNG